MATLDEVTKVMAFLSALWPREPVTKATIKAYSIVLADVDGEAVQAAAEILGGEASPYFPKAGEIKQRALRLLKEDSHLLPSGQAQAQLQPGHYTDEEMYAWEVARGTMPVLPPVLPLVLPDASADDWRAGLIRVTMP